MKKILLKGQMKERFSRIVSLFLSACLLLNTAATGNTADIKMRSIDISDYTVSDKYTDIFEESNISYKEEEGLVNFTASGTYSSGDKVLFDKVSLEEYHDADNNKVTLTDEDIDKAYGEEGLVDQDKIEQDIPDEDISDGNMADESTMDEDIADEDIPDDNMSDEDMTDEDVSGSAASEDEYNDIVSPDDSEYEDTEVDYECTFDMNDLVFHFTAELVAEDGTVLETEEINTKAIVTENGGLDACIEIDGNTYRMSDYEKKTSVDECSIANIIKIINAYLAVAETAEKIKAKSNYKYNKGLEKKGKGVGKGKYVYNQSETNRKNYNAGNYRFGFTKFSNVGCEVASAYNVALALKDSERLSQTIYYFEAFSIEFSIAWGYFGSNPLEINRYLKKRGFRYKKYTSFSKLSSAVKKKKSCKIIMSRWNKPATKGLHTFYVAKSTSGNFFGFNWKYERNSVKKTSLKSFNNGSGFIVGYIVWKD